MQTFLFQWSHEQVCDLVQIKSDGETLKANKENTTLFRKIRRFVAECPKRNTGKYIGLL